MRGTQRRHINSTAQKVGDASTAEPIIEEPLARTPAPIADVQTEFPQNVSQRVLDVILAGLQQAAITLGGTPPKLEWEESRRLIIDQPLKTKSVGMLPQPEFEKQTKS